MMRTDLSDGVMLLGVVVSRRVVDVFSFSRWYTYGSEPRSMSVVGLFETEAAEGSGSGARRGRASVGGEARKLGGRGEASVVAEVRAGERVGESVNIPVAEILVEGNGAVEPDERESDARSEHESCVWAGEGKGG